MNMASILRRCSVSVSWIYNLIIGDNNDHISLNRLTKIRKKIALLYIILTIYYDSLRVQTCRL